MAEDITPLFQKAVVEVARAKGLTDVSIRLDIEDMHSQLVLNPFLSCRMILKSFDPHKYCDLWVQKLPSRKHQRELYVLIFL